MPLSKIREGGIVTKRIIYRADKPLSVKIEKSIELLHKSEALALRYNDFGYHLAFSGGKDSQAVYELCKMANVKFKAFFYKTSVDPSELLHLIRDKYPDVEWIKPGMTMYQLILKKKMLPTRLARFCCAYLKERQGINAVVITGIRALESTRRAARKELEHMCISGQDKVMMHPLFDWSERDVYEFLKIRGVEMCSLYGKLDRIGCIGCPMSDSGQRKEFALFPNFKLAYFNTIKKLMERYGAYKDFGTAENVMDWWTSGLSKKEWIEKRKQTKIEWD